MTRRRKPSDEAAAPLKVSRQSAAAAPSQPTGASYAQALNTGFQATARSVQEMHQAIAGKTFETLVRVPGLSVPTRIVQGVHDAITQGVYGAVRHGGSVALMLAGGAERLAADPDRSLGQKERALRGVLSGVFGDALAASGNALAVQMGLHDRDGALSPSSKAKTAALRGRVCVFLHGLACDEQSWQLRSDAWAASHWANASAPIHYGALLEREAGVSALWLRYNSGLAIEANAQQLGVLLDALARAAPQVAEWLLIGHSMGGLVARRAQALAAAGGLAWARHVPMIVCLGSPHQGAPLEQLGQLATATLAVSTVTRPLA
ncbi:MAG: hypothetical protein H7Y61_10765, partial [Rhizobiales bacterium]|nr:hypothetical protein [Rhizobacter sp.]